MKEGTELSRKKEKGGVEALSEVRLQEEDFPGGSGKKEMAPHSSTPVWRIPWREEPGGPPSTGSPGVGHDRATSVHFHCQ